MDIVTIPNTILAKKLKTVKIEEVAGGKYNELIDHMHEDMIANNGVGLAANQVGQNLAIFVIDKELAITDDVPDVYINPEITEYSKEGDDFEEGCLSIPKYYVDIRRSKKIWIKFIDRDGRKKKIKAKGFLARVLQHEVDHLNGVHIKNRFEGK
jgi:peptide deformylase